MNYVSYIALGISIFALIISAIGLWNSWRARQSSEDAQHHTQIVAFEQRKQELRRIFLEEQLLYGEINVELSRIPDSEWLREKISTLAVIRHQGEISLKNFEKIPSSPSTERRLWLEETGEKIIDSNKSLRELLKALRDHSAALQKSASK